VGFDIILKFLQTERILRIKDQCEIHE